MMYGDDDDDDDDDGVYHMLVSQPLAQRLGEHPPSYADHEHADEGIDKDYGGDDDYDDGAAHDDCYGV